MRRVGIVGVTGYAGEELLRLLLQHPEVEVTYVAASVRAQPAVSVSALYPDLPRAVPLSCEAFQLERAQQLCELCFLALPHGEAMKIVPALVHGDMRVVDLSGDFRLRDPAAYEQWYGFRHASPALLSEAVYGLAEVFRDEIRRARLVANPGCYATSILLGVLPLGSRLVTQGQIIVDAKSGFSGAGREAGRRFRKEEPGNLRPYKVLTEHPHLPEVRQTLARVSGHEPSLLLTPHIVPAERGLLSAIYVTGLRRDGQEDLVSLYQQRYHDEPFVQMLTDRWPSFHDVVQTNRCLMGLRQAGETLLVISALDNLRKGAASQAIHNMNLMCEFDETAGLT